MVHVAQRYGERPEVAYVLPISVDGMLIVASAAMVEDKRNGHRVRWSARIAFAAGVAASVAANIAAAQPTIGARIVAAWPAVAMLLVVEMLSRAKPANPGTDTAPPNEDNADGRTDDPASMALGESLTDPAKPLSDPAPKPPLSVQDDPPTDTSHGARRRRRSGLTADAVARMLAERPDARPADIAREAGVSERHIRRLLTSGAATTGSDLPEDVNSPNLREKHRVHKQAQ
jgi:AraC-like DNA-binding protein